MSSDNASKKSSPKKVILPLPFPMPLQTDEEKAALDQIRPKAKRYADKTFMPPAGTRRSMGKR